MMTSHGAQAASFKHELDAFHFLLTSTLPPIQADTHRTSPGHSVGEVGRLDWARWTGTSMHTLLIGRINDIESDGYSAVNVDSKSAYLPETD